MTQPAAVVWCNQRFGVSLHQIISLLRIITWRFGGMGRDRALPLNNNQCLFILCKTKQNWVLCLHIVFYNQIWDLISLLGLKSCSFQTSSPSGWSSSKLRLQISLRPPSSPSPPPHHWQSGPDGGFQLWVRQKYFGSSWVIVGTDCYQILSQSGMGIENIDRVFIGHLPLFAISSSWNILFHFI